MESPDNVQVFTTITRGYPYVQYIRSLGRFWVVKIKRSLGASGGRREERQRFGDLGLVVQWDGPAGGGCHRSGDSDGSDVVGAGTTN